MLAKAPNCVIAAVNQSVIWFFSNFFKSKNPNSLSALFRPCTKCKLCTELSVNLPDSLFLSKIVSSYKNLANCQKASTKCNAWPAKRRSAPVDSSDPPWFRSLVGLFICQKVKPFENRGLGSLPFACCRKSKVQKLCEFSGRDLVRSAIGPSLRFTPISKCRSC